MTVPAIYAHDVIPVTLKEYFLFSGTILGDTLAQANRDPSFPYIHAFG